MQLYDNPISPFCRKVCVILQETGQWAETELIPVTGNPLARDGSPVAPNPLGKLPALVTPEGRVLYDSRVICRYLDDRAGAGLYPAAPALWDVLTLEATADGMLEAAVLMIYEERFRPEDQRSADWVEGQWAKVSRALDQLETQWIAGLGGPLDAGQIAVASALGYLDFRHAGREWRLSRGLLAAWYAAFSMRDSMVATVPPG